MSGRGVPPLIRSRRAEEKQEDRSKTAARAQRNIMLLHVTALRTTHTRLTYLPYLLARRGRTSPSLFDWSLLQFFAYS